MSYPLCNIFIYTSKMGIRIVPFCLFPFRITLPTAWTISTSLLLGSTKVIPSNEGTSTPSVRQRALVIKLGSASINLWISAALSPVLFLPETWNVDNFSKFLLTFVNSEFISLNLFICVDTTSWLKFNLKISAPEKKSFFYRSKQFFVFLGLYTI